MNRSNKNTIVKDSRSQYYALKLVEITKGTDDFQRQRNLSKSVTKRRELSSNTLKLKKVQLNKDSLAANEQIQSQVSNPRPKKVKKLTKTISGKNYLSSTQSSKQKGSRVVKRVRGPSVSSKSSKQGSGKNRLTKIGKERSKSRILNKEISPKRASILGRKVITTTPQQKKRSGAIPRPRARRGLSSSKKHSMMHSSHQKLPEYNRNDNFRSKRSSTLDKNNFQKFKNEQLNNSQNVHGSGVNQAAPEKGIFGRLLGGWFG